MRLLDTHFFVPMGFGELRLTDGPVAVSAITAAEISCLVRIGRLRLDLPVDVWFDRATQAGDVTVLPLTPRLLARAMHFPWHHRDPADRILIQHLLDQPELSLVTRDRTLRDYAKERGLSLTDV